MRKNVFSGLMLSCLFLSSAGLTSCLNSDEETIVLEEFLSGIPSDSQATPNPSVPSLTPIFLTSRQHLSQQVVKLLSVSI